MQKIFLIVLLVSSGLAFSKIPDQIGTVLVHPIYDKYYLCAEHTGSQDWGLGDSLGADCIIHVLERLDGLKISLAHLREIKIKKGDKVKAGQIIGLVGNNGKSWHPHIHIGAWKNQTPMQLRFDQHKILMR